MEIEKLSHFTVKVSKDELDALKKIANSELRGFREQARMFIRSGCENTKYLDEIANLQSVIEDYKCDLRSLIRDSEQLAEQLEQEQNPGYMGWQIIQHKQLLSVLSLKDKERL